MKSKTSKEELSTWEQCALRGDFSHMPQPFGWRDSARFSHFLNGYEEAGGFDPLARLALAMSERARDTGRWAGSAKELWFCLFFEHRAARHTGSDPESEELERLNALCETLRLALQALDEHEARALASRLKAS